MPTWKRLLRTPSSERFVALEDGRQISLIDLHFLPSGRVSGTVVLLPRGQDESAEWSDEQVPDLLASLDEDQLPAVDLASGNFTYTVVVGKLVGQYEVGSEPDRDR